MTTEEIIDINKRLKAPFKGLSFVEDSHIYTVEGRESEKIKSVSSLLKYFYEEFDTNTVSEKWAKDRHLPSEWVRKAWEGEGLISTTHGTKVHAVGENYANYKFLGIGECPEPFDKQSLGAIQFINDLPDYLVPVATELQMYDSELWFCGTCDGVLYNTKNGKFLIYDFKTNKTLTGPYGKIPLIGLPTEYGLLQNNFGKYSLQFSFYQILLELTGVEVQARILVHLEEDKKNKKLYKTYKTKNVTSDLKVWLNSRVHLK